ncbi:NUDIX hydrolase [Nocardioides jejuensis]|uniref:NUDIX domain-containing protein n=1 Tax=Nocardioides jejuensis TaxID=2502782 RepID=A0A4R1CIY7_9ACTN|nr:NUDIX domain-containing protein [Nocardioides jejuensis]TCJ31229.1 NUDIX domain-containing protein [Nocardioides jejuensis]
MSLHADASRVLADWVAPTDDQEQLRQRYAEVLSARPDAMGRSCRPDHLTASTLVISADGSSVLLTLHAKAQAWFQFGGHCEDGDATLAGAALREAREESGLSDLALDPVPVQLSEHAVPFCGGPLSDAESGGDPTRTVHHLDVRFVAVAPAGAAHAVSEESLDVRWWPADALPTEDQDMIELVALAKDRLGF